MPPYSPVKLLELLIVLYVPDSSNIVYGFMVSFNQYFVIVTSVLLLVIPREYCFTVSGAMYYLLHCEDAVSLELNDGEVHVVLFLATM